ncbi:hypothetical protein C1H46_030728 [Malus baccata]|uniref:Uncharacterized protein n=1 Tax=Malus baccata TaxID=106549 RepID=A0A540LB43_MALBA|nr:hypothetical protein C1H46_030728 [Malus baccata]
MCSNWQAPIRNYISYPLPSFTSPPPTYMSDLHRGQVLEFSFLRGCDDDGDVVFVAGGQGLYCLFFAAFGPKFVEAFPL